MARTRNRSEKPAPSRVIIDRLVPQLDCGRHAVKRTVGESLHLSAVIVCDGHELLRAELLWREGTAGEWESSELRATGNDTYVGELIPLRPGRYQYTVRAWIDRLGSWGRDLIRRVEGQQSESELLAELDEAELLLRSRATDLGEEGLREAIAELRGLRAGIGGEAGTRALVDYLRGERFRELSSRLRDPLSETSFGRELPLEVDPELARFSSWYEFFPRSTGAPGEHGTLRTAIARLEYAAGLGFDVIYLPPIHPVGQERRKGKNNAETSVPGDVGSPWAIGSHEGGHTEVHPELGGREAFREFVARARELGVQVAMDLAFQCAPDHPYVRSHPEWFRHCPDGSIRFAENPPKKYQDIYPLDFEGEQWRELWDELRDVTLSWVQEGIRVFRVDNPHTKPFRFWEWLISEVRRRDPEVIFLSEAFTRPHVMNHLAKCGFSQSYTYFTWRNSRQELERYAQELFDTELAEYLRPNFWPNTPDILPGILQTGRRGAFLSRLILAATMSPSYGIYGPAFELMEHLPARPGSEEYLDSEKYQLREWDTDRSDSLAPVIRRINRIRRENAALRSSRSFRSHPVSNDRIFAFSKFDPESENRILVVVNLDPWHRQSGWVELPLAEWGIPPDQGFQVHDLISDARYLWSGPGNYVELDPESMPAHVLRVRARGRTEGDFEYFG